MEFSKYECYNKLLGGVTLFKVTPSVSWTQPIHTYIYIYIYINPKNNRHTHISHI